MFTSMRAILLFSFIAASVTAASNQFVKRYVAVGTSGSADLLAVDTSDNFFIVATVVEPSGSPQIRAIKTDPQGNQIASFDFGSGSGDTPSGAAVDPQGNLVGTTSSPNFPLVSPFTSTTSGGGFVVKLDSQLTKILFSTLLGSRANAVALDSAGNIYVTGSTGDPNFPVTPGAFQTSGPTPTGFGTPIYAFLTEISPDGSSIVYSTFFGSASTNCNGGSSCIGEFGNTGGSAITLDTTSAILIGGWTTASQLPITPGTLGQQCGCLQTMSAGHISSCFLAKFAPSGK